MFCFVRKEVFIVGFSTAILVNLVVTRCFLNVIHFLPLTKNKVVDQVRIKSYCTVLLGVR